MSFKLIFMRHAESDHNLAKRAIKKNLNCKKIKKTAHYQKIKFLPSLRDDSLTPQGVKQAQQAALLIDWKTTPVILVSPLRRCLQTCQIMLQNSDHPAKVIVEPLLMSRFTNAWSLGSEKGKLQQQFPNMSFQNLVDVEIPWYARNLKAEDQAKFLNKSDSLAVLESGLEQSYHEFHERGKKLKAKIESVLRRIGPMKLLVISHSCTLKLLVAEQFEEGGKSVSSISFDNGSPVYIKGDRVLAPRAKI